MKYLNTFNVMSEKLKGEQYMNMDDDDFDPSTITSRQDMFDYLHNSDKNRLKKMINTWDDDSISELIRKRCGVCRYCKDHHIELSEITDFLTENLKKIKVFISNGIGNGEFKNENGKIDNVLLRVIDYLEYPDMKEIAIMFIDAGVNLETTVHNGKTAIMCAADKGDFDIVKKLIIKGVNVNHTMKPDNENILQIIARSTYAHFSYERKNTNLQNDFKKIIDLILSTDVDIENKTKYDKTPLMFALGNILRAFSENSNESDIENFKQNEIRVYLVQQLIEKGADLEYETSESYSIRKQLTKLNYTVVEYLLKNCKSDRLKIILNSKKYNL